MDTIKDELLTIIEKSIHTLHSAGELQFPMVNEVLKDDLNSFCETHSIPKEVQYQLLLGIKLFHNSVLRIN